MAIPQGGRQGDRELRQCALAVSVLCELDLTPSDDGVVLPGTPQVEVSWDECAVALGQADPSSDDARRRLERWLRTRRQVADRTIEELAEMARPLGLPVGHPLHPGPDWTYQHVLGGALDLGFGFVGLDPSAPDAVRIAPPRMLEATGIDPTPWWYDATEYLENMGAMAAVRFRRNRRVPLRPMGDCDVVTLLGSTMMRGALLAGSDGMRAVAAPMRTRGWLDPSRIDPAFVIAAAAATEPEERGFARPVLITTDEVVMAQTGGNPAEIVLRDPAPATPWQRDVLYH